MPKPKTDKNEAVIRQEKTSLAPQNLDDLYRYAKALAASPLLPKGLVGSGSRGGFVAFEQSQIVANVYLCLGYGAELGLSPMQSLSGVMIVNNRPAIWGDALIGVVRGSGLVEYINEEQEGDPSKPITCVAVCEAKRKDTREVIRREFTWHDAIAGGHAGKDLYLQHPKRMLQMRARAFCLRDAFADVLKGFGMAEELQDADLSVQVDPDVPRPERLVETKDAQVVDEVEKDTEETTETTSTLGIVRVEGDDDVPPHMDEGLPLDDQDAQQEDDEPNGNEVDAQELLDAVAEIEDNGLLSLYHKNSKAKIDKLSDADKERVEEGIKTQFDRNLSGA